MRFTAAQRFINDERGLAIWNSSWKNSAYYLCFQCVFSANLTSKYKSVCGRVNVVNLRACASIGLLWRCAFWIGTKIDHYVIFASVKSEQLGKLINRIPGSRLLISSLPGSATRRHVESLGRVNKGAKIRNWYNQVPHLTQDTNGKVTNSQLDSTNETQEVSPFPTGDHKAQRNRCAQMHSKRKTEKT